MFRRAKKRIKVELVLDIEVREVKRDTQYQGRVIGFGVPLKFEIEFELPLSTLEGYARLGEKFKAPAQKITDVLEQALKGRYKLKIVREDELPIDAISEELEETLLRPILIAIGLLGGKPGTSEATFHVPHLVEEEMDQFRKPGDLMRYILSLNK